METEAHLLQAKPTTHPSYVHRATWEDCWTAGPSWLSGQKLLETETEASTLRGQPGMACGTEEGHPKSRMH